jgi:sulfide:quinone oxidoreductase
MSLPILGSIGCDIIESRLAEFGIGFLPSRKAAAVENKQVVFQDGEKRSFDLLLGVAPHKCPDVILASGLTNGRPWIAPDPRTLETSFSEVYAIGDCVSIPLADGKQLPKAGIFAELQGKVVAERIATRLQGQEPSASYDGTGFCFLEFGGGKVAYVRGNFYAQPAPEVVLTEMSSKFLEEKQAFEKDRLAVWFGI